MGTPLGPNSVIRLNSALGTLESKYCQLGTPPLGYDRTMSLVVVGSVAYDGVETPHGKVDRMLGGACTYISLAASYFTGVNIVAVVGEDFAQEDCDLLAGRGIHPARPERVPGQTFFFAVVYSADTHERTP